MHLIFAYITVVLLRLAKFFANTQAAKHYINHAITYEWELRN